MPVGCIDKLLLALVDSVSDSLQKPACSTGLVAVVWISQGPLNLRQGILSDENPFQVFTPGTFYRASL